MSDGKVIQWGLMNCHRDSSMNPLVPVGKSYPPQLEPSDLQAVKDTLQRLVTELGICFGPMNVELIVDANSRVFPIDIGPRSGGNMIPDLLGMIFKCDIVEMSIRAALGEHVQASNMEPDVFFATHNIHSKEDGIFSAVELSTEIEPYVIRKEIYKRPGDKVYYFSNASQALGILFFKFKGLDEMNRYLSNINSHIIICMRGGVSLIEFNCHLACETRRVA